MIHINLNMILYTHVKHSPTKTIYTHTHTHTHTHTVQCACAVQVGYAINGRFIFLCVKCGADSLGSDRLGCFNLSVRGHGWVSLFCPVISLLLVCWCDRVWLTGRFVSCVCCLAVCYTEMALSHLGMHAHKHARMPTYMHIHTHTHTHTHTL